MTALTLSMFLSLLGALGAPVVAAEPESGSGSGSGSDATAELPVPAPASQTNDPEAADEGVPEPEPSDAAELEPVPESVAKPDLEPVPEPVPTPDLAPDPVGLSAPGPASATDPVPVSAAEPVPVAAPLPTPAPEPTPVGAQAPEVVRAPPAPAPAPAPVSAPPVLELSLAGPEPGSTQVPLVISHDTLDHWCTDHWSPDAGVLTPPAAVEPSWRYRPHWGRWVAGALMVAAAVPTNQWAASSRDRFYDLDTDYDDVTRYYLQANLGWLGSVGLVGVGAATIASGFVPKESRPR